MDWLSTGPPTKISPKQGAFALIQYLKKKQEEDSNAQCIRMADIAVDTWIENFTAIETSPRTGINASKNRPYSPDTVQTYLGYWETHIKDDLFMALKMAEVEEEDAAEYIGLVGTKNCCAIFGSVATCMYAPTGRGLQVPQNTQYFENTAYFAFFNGCCSETEVSEQLYKALSWYSVWFPQEIPLEILKINVYDKLRRYVYGYI
jgi:hypothetical protein